MSFPANWWDDKQFTLDLMQKLCGQRDQLKSMVDSMFRLMAKDGGIPTKITFEDGAEDFELFESYEDLLALTQNYQDGPLLISVLSRTDYNDQTEASADPDPVEPGPFDFSFLNAG